MASTPTNTPQEHASTISVFAKGLQDRISSTIASSDTLAIPDDTLRTLDTHLNQLPLPRAALSVSTRRQLDTNGTELWNTCMQVTVTCMESVVLGLLARVKYLAFVMIESAAPRRGPGNVRALELALRTAKDCLGSGHLEIGLKALEAAAARLDTYKKSELDKSRPSTVTTKYYMLRIYLSWLQGRPDIAEHLFSKITNIQGSLEQRKTIIEVCYIIGSSALSNGQPDVAVGWLERALGSSLSSNQDSQSDLAMKDMRMLTQHAFVRAHLQLRTASSWEHALQALTALRTEYRDIFPVVMLQLEVLSREEQPSKQEYLERLGAAIRMMEVTNESLRIIFYYIQKLGNLSWDLSFKMFEKLLLEKLVLSNNHTLIGQYFVAFIWMATNSNSCSSQELDTIEKIAKRLAECGIHPLAEDATHASLVLIWRRIESMISNGDLSMAERWCQFVLEQPIFQSFSMANRGILQRKLMVCALNDPSTSLPYESLERILEQSQDTPSTLYLAYKMALLHDEPELGTRALEALYKLRTIGAIHLLSCAAEAQRLGKMQQVMDCVQRAVAVLECCCQEESGFPTLVRSTICILSTELNNCKTDGIELMEQLRRIFEVALNEASKSINSYRIFSTDDIEWLFQKSYNIALQSIKSSHYSPAIGLLDISSKLADLYPTSEPKDEPRVSQHYLSCNILKALVLTTEAREKTDPLEKKIHYNSLRVIIQHFRAHIANKPQPQKNYEATPTKWYENYRTLLTFDFEAAIFLSQWDSLPSIIEESNEFADEKLCAIFLDSILSSKAPVTEMVKVVMTIINILHTSPSPTLNKSSFEASLPRYLRCLFQLSLQANETPLAEVILDKAISLAQGHENEDNSVNENYNGSGKAKSYHYPNEELEWLATVTFNKAIDFYLVSADEECKRWAGKATEIADLVEYNHGALGRLLRANLAKLS